MFELSTAKLIILANEAERQRVLDAMVLAQAINNPNSLADIDDVHGDYTEGFYDKQRQFLRSGLSG